jgi:nucleotide-binding universal stress UspA family protein
LTSRVKLLAQTVLICFDGSEDAKLAVKRAAALFPGQSALVIHVWEPLSEVASVPAVPGLGGVLRAGLDEMDERGEEVSQQLAEEGCELARGDGLAAEPLSVRRAGRAWRAILAVAEERDADVIVIGRRGASRAELKILGSVANAVVQHADRPVLLVPTVRDGA